MKVNCYRINNELQMIPCEYDTAIESIGHSDLKTWINLRDFETNELEEKLDDLGVKGLAKRFCLESFDYPGFYPMKTQALMVIAVQSEGENSKPLEYLALLCRPESLFSFHKTQFYRFQNTDRIRDSVSWLPDNGIAGLVSSIMLRLSLDSLQKTATIRDKIMQLEQQIEYNPNAFKIEELSNKQTELLTLESIVHGQIPILEALISTDRPTINIENTREYLNLGDCKSQIG